MAESMFVANNEKKVIDVFSGFCRGRLCFQTKTQFQSAQSMNKNSIFDYSFNLAINETVCLLLKVLLKHSSNEQNKHLCFCLFMLGKKCIHEFDSILMII